MSDIKDWANTAAGNNTGSPPDNAPENGCNFSDWNNIYREFQAGMRRQHEQAEWIDLGHTPTHVTTGQFTVTGDQTAIYKANRATRALDNGSYVYGHILTVSYSSVTTVTTDMATTSNLTDIAVGITQAGSNSSYPKEMNEVLLEAPAIKDTGKDHKYTIGVSELTANRIVTLPLLTGNDEFLFKDHAATVTNKTVDLSSNTLTGTTAEFNAALSDGSFATLAGTESLTNKTIGDTNTINAQDDAFTIDDATDATKQIDFNAAGTTSTKTTLTSSQTANRVLTLPDATDTLTGKATTDTLTNKTIDLANNTILGTVSELSANLDSGNSLINGASLYSVSSGTTGSIAGLSDTDITVTHGLGTDDVIIEVMAKGNTVADDWTAIAVRVDGLHVLQIGDATNQPTIPANPSSGDIVVTLKNTSGSAQTITYAIRVSKFSF